MLILIYSRIWEKLTSFCRKFNLSAITNLILDNKQGWLDILFITTHATFWNGSKIESHFDKLFAIKYRFRHAGKAGGASNDYVVGAAGTVDNQQIAIVIPVAHDAYVFILRVKHQISRLGLVPRDVGTVGVLHVDTAAVAYDVLSIRDIVKYPIDK